MQIAKQVVNLNPTELRLPSRAWKVKLVGEGADDAGGVFDDTITEMCQVGSFFLVRAYRCGLFVVQMFIIVFSVRRSCSLVW